MSIVEQTVTLRSDNHYGRKVPPMPSAKCYGCCPSL